MGIDRLFPTLVYSDLLLKKGLNRLNEALLHDIEILRWDDHAGILWSEKNYPHGYTSYSSFSDLHMRLGSFNQLEKALEPHLHRYVQALQMDLDPRSIKMTTCWVNVMSTHCHHSWHMHPLSVISGTYYLKVPHKGGPFKVEDPRLNCFMGAPPRLSSAPRAMRNFVTYHPKEGRLLMFESWLRHEVPVNLAEAERISISFNYEWERS